MLSGAASVERGSRVDGETERAHTFATMPTAMILNPHLPNMT